MKTETQHTSVMTTPSQETARRLFVKANAQSESRLKRIGANAAVAIGATAVDLGESYVAEKLLEVVFDKKIEHLEDLASQKKSKAKEQVERKILETKGLKMGVAFVEDSMSDSLYATASNALLRSATGMDDAAYVKESAAFLSEWANVISLVFGNRPKDMSFWKKSENFVNPVNVEAFMRILEDVPVVGDATAWGREKLEHLLHKSQTFKTTNMVVAKFVTGYHIQKNMMGL